MNIQATTELINITYKAVCLTGHSPPLHDDKAIKFLMAHAILKVETKKAVRRLHILLINKKIIKTPPRKA